MKVVKINQIDEIIKILAAGGVVALPTDTAYALAVDATNKKAVDKVFKIKNRKPEKLLSWFFSDINQIKNFSRLKNYQLSILEQYLPGPYTFIIPSRTYGTIGLRITDHPITQAVVEEFDKPLTATSANISGQPPARSVKDLGGLPIDLIVDGGTIPDRLTSTVVDLTQLSPLVVRRGLGRFPK